jgi:hypothetical protein
LLLLLNVAFTCYFTTHCSSTYLKHFHVAG